MFQHVGWKCLWQEMSRALATSARQALPPAAPLLRHSQWPKVPSGFLTAESLRPKVCLSRGSSPRAHFSLRGSKSPRLGPFKFACVNAPRVLVGSKSQAFICSSGFGAEAGGEQLTSGCTEARALGSGGVARRWSTWTWEPFPVPSRGGSCSHVAWGRAAVLGEPEGAVGSILGTNAQIVLVRPRHWEPAVGKVRSPAAQ